MSKQLLATLPARIPKHGWPYVYLALKDLDGSGAVETTTEELSEVFGVPGRTITCWLRNCVRDGIFHHIHKISKSHIRVFLTAEETLREQYKCPRDDQGRWLGGLIEPQRHNMRDLRMYAIWNVANWLQRRSLTAAMETWKEKHPRLKSQVRSYFSTPESILASLPQGVRVIPRRNDETIFGASVEAIALLCGVSKTTAHKYLSMLPEGCKAQQAVHTGMSIRRHLDIKRLDRISGEWGSERSMRTVLAKNDRGKLVSVYLMTNIYNLPARWYG